jgi:hypothetical protein
MPKLYPRAAVAFLAVCVAAIASVALVGSPAHAATGQPAAAPAAPAAHATSSSAAGGVPDQAVPIACTLTVDNPHNSSHVNGVVNVTGRIRCTAAVTAMNLLLTLTRDGVDVVSNQNDNMGVPTLSNSVATPCVNGTYQASAIGGIFFPPGFVPFFEIVSGFSNTVVIVC